MILLLSSSPNKDGLTAACVQAAIKGITEWGESVKHIDLCQEKIKSCLTCGNGWGQCLEKHECILDDGFRHIQQLAGEARGLYLITPVYWWQPSEPMKYFMDRFRRCEARRGQESALAGKKVNFVAAAGGSGNGTVNCLQYMETWARHVSAVPQERIGITRFNREPMLSVLAQCAKDITQYSEGTLK